MRKQIRLRRLLAQYIGLHKHWEEKVEYYFSNHSYYLCDYQIEDEYDALFQEACTKRNVFYWKVEKLKNKIWFK